MKDSSESPIVVLSSRLLAPFIQLFALYVIFQGGTMLAASIILMRLAVGTNTGEIQFRRIWSSKLSAGGLSIYALAGLTALIMGGNYLDYKFLPLYWLPEPEIRAMGILIVEIGVAVAVMATLVSIYDDLLEEDKND
jgi:multicomponent Na+:H+ antiporter subunit B